MIILKIIKWFIKSLILSLILLYLINFIGSFINIKNNIQNKFKYVDDIEKNVASLVDQTTVEQFIANNYECEE